MDIIEIKGKINTAICYARVVEDEAIEQIRRMCDYPMTEGSRIRIMEVCLLLEKEIRSGIILHLTEQDDLCPEQRRKQILAWMNTERQ